MNFNDKRKVVVHALKVFMQPVLTAVCINILYFSGFEINFVENWPIGHLSQILTGQTISVTGHMQEQLNFNDKCFY